MDFGRQDFENTFWNLFQTHGEAVAAVTSEPGASGREAFVHFVSSLRDVTPSQAKEPRADNPSEITIEMYHQWYPEHEAQIGHYFQTLHDVVRYIKEQGDSRSLIFVRLIRAQLSSHELQLLLYHGLSQYGDIVLKPLIEEFTLLKHLKKSDENREACRQYARTAFIEPPEEEERRAG